MRINIVDPGDTSVAAPTWRTTKDMDYLAARLHGRKSRMAEAERLDSLCRIGSLGDLFHVVFPESRISGVLDFQRSLVYELAGELSGFRANISGPGVNLINWTLVRFQMENLKVLIRAFLTKVPIEDPDEYLIPLPKELTLDIRGLAEVESPEGFVRLFPKEGILRRNMEKALEIYRDNPRPFFFEAALDCSYFQGLVFRMEKLSQEDREIITPMVHQEIDIFHLMLIARGRFHYGLAPSMLQPFHVEGTRIKRSLFTAMLNDPDLYTSVGRVGERIFDSVPFEWGTGDGSNAVDASVLEGLAWNRFFRLANMVFRRSHMGLGAIMGYAGLRRVEVANLITISEGIRGGMAGETIRGRLIPRTDLLKVA